MQIAIDGPSGAGKSTIAKKLAAHYHILYLDTGAMYRTAALAALRAGIDLHDASQVKRVVDQANIEVRYEEGAQHVYLDGEDVSGKIRTEEVSMAASAVSAVSAVREKLVALQRQTAKKLGAVLDGRDIGTYVLVNADYKFFLTASAAVRAKRRTDELLARGQKAEYAEVLAAIEKRDHDDSTRAVSPLVRADDAILIDSSDMTIDEVVAAMRRAIDGGEK